MKLNKRRLWYILCAVLALLALLCVWVFNWLGGVLIAQQRAEVWQGESDTRFAQVSVFFPVDAKAGLDDVYSFRSGLEGRLLEVSLEPGEDARYWCDAYSAITSLTVASSADSVEAAAVAVGGDFFQFHPLFLLDGGYFSDGDLMEDLVVLDEELAWKLFSSNAITGQTVTIGGYPFIVSGVVDRESDFADTRAYTGGAGIYLSYAALTKLLGSEPGVSCYELILANPVSGFAKGVVTDTFSEETNVVVENSTRFNVGSIFQIMGSFGEWSMNTRGVVFPYWENAARLIETYMAAALFLILLFGALPALYALILIVKNAIKYWRKFIDFLPRFWEARREARWAAEEAAGDVPPPKRSRRGKHAASRKGQNR